MIEVMTSWITYGADVPEGVDGIIDDVMDTITDTMTSAITTLNINLPEAFCDVTNDDISDVTRPSRSPITRIISSMNYLAHVPSGSSRRRTICLPLRPLPVVLFVSALSGVSS